VVGSLQAGRFSELLSECLIRSQVSCVCECVGERISNNQQRHTTMEKVRKPASWENNTLDELMEIEAGQAYVVRQFGGNVAPEFSAQSSRENQDTAEYEVFEDGSLLFTNNAQDVVHFSASDWANEELTGFQDVRWDEDTAGDGFVIDDMDRSLMTYLWGEEAAKRHFMSHGGVVASEKEKLCRENRGLNYLQVRDQIQELGWDGIYPEVDEYGCLTGEVVDASSDQHTICDVTEEGLEFGDQCSDAMAKAEDNQCEELGGGYYESADGTVIYSPE